MITDFSSVKFILLSYTLYLQNRQTPPTACV